MTDRLHPDDLDDLRQAVIAAIVPAEREVSEPAGDSLELASARLVSFAQADNTRRTYRAQVRMWERWCTAHDIAPRPARPDHVVEWLTERHDNGDSLSTIKVAHAALRDDHRRRGLAVPTDHPAVRLVIEGISRAAAGAGQRQALPLTAARAAAVIDAGAVVRPTETPAAAQERDAADVAMIETMRCAMLRRVEAAHLQWHDLDLDAGTATLRQSKTDQRGRGHVLWLSPAAVEALHRLQAVRGGPQTGAVLAMTPATVSRRLAVAGRHAGIAGLTGHSPRVGMAVDLIEAGYSLPAVMQAGRWNSPAMVTRYGAQALAGDSALADWHTRHTPGHPR